MNIETKTLGNINIDTAEAYFRIFFIIADKGYIDRNRGEMFFHFPSKNIDLDEYYNINKNKIIKFIDEYDYIKDILEKYIVNNIFDDEENLRCLSSVLNFELINDIIEYLKDKIINLKIKILDDGPVLPNIKLLLFENVELFCEIKEHIINYYGNRIIISYNNMFCPPNITIFFNKDKIEINVLYEVEKNAINSSMKFELNENYEIIHSFFDYIEPWK